MAIIICWFYLNWFVICGLIKAGMKVRWWAFSSVAEASDRVRVYFELPIGRSPGCWTGYFGKHRRITPFNNLEILWHWPSSNKMDDIRWFVCKIILLYSKGNFKNCHCWDIIKLPSVFNSAFIRTSYICNNSY